MCTRLPKLDTYSIENLSGLAARCDWFINGCQLLNITNTETPRTIFVTGYRGGDGINHLAMQLLPKLTTKFVLIVASEDYTFPYGKGDVRYHTYMNSQEQIIQIINSPLLIHIFVENLDEPNNPKMSPIPLGTIIPNMKIDINDPQILNINMHKKIVMCFCAHRIRNNTTQWDDRKKVKSYCIKKGQWHKFVKYIDGKIPRPVFLKELKKAKFCLCVHGGGYDPNPRFTESILAGAIPIIQHSPLDKVFSMFPVVFIDKWTSPDTLSQEFLEQKLAELRPFYENSDKRRTVLRMLTLDYWWDIIISKYDSI